MHILDALSVADHYNTDPSIKDTLIIAAKKFDYILPPRLFQRYEITQETLEDISFNSKQYICLYATVMKAKIKEYYSGQKGQLLCNVYVPEKYTRKLYVYYYAPIATGYISLLKTHAMSTLIAMEEMMQQVSGTNEEQSLYKFDELFDDNVALVYNVTPEKELPKITRRHKKSMSHYEFQSETKLQLQSQIQQQQIQDKALFFSSSKPVTLQDDYQFPSLEQVPETKAKRFTFEEPQQQQQQKEENPNIDDFDFFPSLEMSHQMSCPVKHSNTDQKKQNFNPVYTGRLKFFDEQKNYGFIVMDDDKSDIFVHLDDLQKAGVTKEVLKSAKQGSLLRFQFNCMVYVGKYKKSRKAVDLKLLNQVNK